MSRAYPGKKKSSRGLLLILSDFCAGYTASPQPGRPSDLNAGLSVITDIGRGGKARSIDKIVAWAVRPRETAPWRSSAEGAVDFENRPRDGVPDGSGLG